MGKAIRQIPAFWRRRSLKFWLATGMLMTILPIFTATVAGYFMFHQKITWPLVEVAFNQRTILQPLQDLQLSLWDISATVSDFAADGIPQRAKDYNHHARRIDQAFSDLVPAVNEHGLEGQHVKLARDDWKKVSTISRELLADGYLHGDPEVVKRVETFEDSIDRLGHDLGKVYEDVRVETEKTHDQALSALVLSEQVAIAAFVISLLSAGLGVIIINRSLVSSMDELASGALRLASGDRSQHVQVQIPQELVNVATAFNLMADQILEQEAALEKVAKTDGLTGLYNRREFDHILAEEIHRGARYDSSVSLIMLDVDHFKKFNDTYGHQGGDEALRAVAATMKSEIRKVDKACRFGGEEFIIVLPACDIKAAQQTAESIRTVIETGNIMLEDGQKVKITASFGVATYPQAGTTPEAMLKAVDAALYKSKENGRNRVTGAT